MPNWCTNYIVISGDENKISLLKNILEDVPKSKEDESIVFETLIGKEPTITTEDYENGGWFDSNVNWFGTKWDVSYSDCQFEFGDDNIIMMPMTAWSPPVGFVSNLCKIYGVTAVMDYDESGCNFCGRAHIDINGEVDEEDYGFNEGKYHFDNEYFWESLVESHMEYSLDEDKTKDQFLLDYPYVNEDDLKELGEMYDKYMIENLKTENNE
jgi:hypothetical protein